MNKTASERLTDSFLSAMNDLYHKGDRNKPIFAEGTMEHHQNEYAATYIHGLRDIERAAINQKQAADQLEAKAKQDLSNHLTDAQLQAAALRKPFVEKDAAKLDIQSFCENARQAANSGNKASCLAYLEVMPEPERFEDQQAVKNARETLKQAIIPPDLRNAGQRANQMRLDAEIERVAAKSALFDLSGEPARNFNPFE